MTDVHHTRLQDAQPRAWRNGGGVTHELLAWPGPEPWLLRVSVATIDRSGPFSAFPDVERWFTVLSGAGVLLVLADAPRALVPGDEPVQFDGEDAPGCTLVDGPTTDLNLMLRRGAGVAAMQRAVAGSRVEGATRWRGLFAAAPALLAIDGVAEPVPAGTLVWSDSQKSSTWCLLSRLHAGSHTDPHTDPHKNPHTGSPSNTHAGSHPGSPISNSAAWWLTLQS